MWAAYYQFDGDQRHTIAVNKFEGAVRQAMADFVERMSHPEVGVWFTWVEECDGRPDISGVCGVHNLLPQPDEKE